LLAGSHAVRPGKGPRSCLLRGGCYRLGDGTAHATGSRARPPLGSR
jgi:hypothetical protein